MDFWALLVILLVAGMVQGTTGFGFGLVATGALAVVMPLPQVVVIVTVASLFCAALNLWMLRHAVPWRETWPLLVTALPAQAAGVYLLATLPTRVLNVGLAVMIVFGCVVTLWAPKQLRLTRPFPGAYLAGLVGGLFGGALGTGGPPVVLYSLLRDWDKSTAKALMSAYFVVTSLWRLGFLSAGGMATREAVVQGLWALVPALFTSYLGTRVFRRLSTQTFRYAVMLLLTGIAAKLILT